MIREILYKWFGLEEFPCHSCETLKIQLALKNEENTKLLNTILEMNKPKEEIKVETRTIQPVQPKNIPWSVRRQMIEAEDRKAAELIAKKAREAAEQGVDETIRELEKELGVEDAS